MRFSKKFFSLFLSAVILSAVLCTNVCAAANDKSTLTDYAGMGNLKMSEKQLCSFDSFGDFEITGGLSSSIDTNDKKEGSGCLSVDFGNAYGESVRVFDCEDFTPIDCSAGQGRVVTFKMWIYINDISLIFSDHEDLYGGKYDYSNTGTIYLRATNGTSDVYHAINQTVHGSGWQEIEFAFEQNNGIKSDFDRSYVKGFCLTVKSIASGLVVKADDLRVCTYTNEGYKDDGSGMPEGSRLISYCDYDGLCGDVICEWFNSDFSTDIKAFGSSSYHLKSTGGDDERMFWGDLDIPIDRQNDYICFWLYVDNFSNLDGFFIEINEVQDKHEYEIKNAFTKLISSSREPLTSNKWVMIQLPIRLFDENLDTDSYGDTLTAKHFRICPSAKKGTEMNVYIDNICIATKSQVDAYNAANPIEEENGGSSSNTLGPSQKEENTEKDSTSGSIIIYAAIIGGAVLLVAAFLIVAVIVKKKKTNAPVKAAEKNKAPVKAKTNPANAKADAEDNKDKN